MSRLPFSRFSFYEGPNTKNGKMILDFRFRCHLGQPTMQLLMRYVKRMPLLPAQSPRQVCSVGRADPSVRERQASWQPPADQKARRFCEPDFCGSDLLTVLARYSRCKINFFFSEGKSGIIQRRFVDSRCGFIIGKCNNSIQPSIYVLKCSLVEEFLT